MALLICLLPIIITAVGGTFVYFWATAERTMPRYEPPTVLPFPATYSSRQRPTTGGTGAYVGTGYH
jgi:hypothetical protein